MARFEPARRRALFGGRSSGRGARRRANFFSRRLVFGALGLPRRPNGFLPPRLWIQGKARLVVIAAPTGGAINAAHIAAWKMKRGDKDDILM